MIATGKDYSLHFPENYFIGCLRKSILYGFHYRLSRSFDDTRIKDIRFMKIHKIRLWYAVNIDNGNINYMVNGICLTFLNLLEGSLYVTEERYGSHLKGTYKDFELKHNEYIIEAKISGVNMCCDIYFKTNLGNVISIGEKKNFKILYMEKEEVVIGTYGEYGSFLYNFGIYSISLIDLELARRETYLRVGYLIKKNKELKNEIKRSILQKDFKEKSCENALKLWSILPKIAYCKVLIFII